MLRSTAPLLPVRRSYARASARCTGVLAAGLLAGCSAGAPATTTIRISGSSTVFPIVNQANDSVVRISTRELARLWGRQAEGRILRWRQVNADCPDRPLRLCGPGRDPGTFDDFNKAIADGVLPSVETVQNQTFCAGL